MKNENIMNSILLKIDEVDRNIISLIQKDPSLTHTEIAKKVNRSQPTVGMRIKKLEENGILKFQAGINIKLAELQFAQIEIQTNQPEQILDIANRCPFMLNAYKTCGLFNISILIAGLSVKDVDEIVNLNFRKNPAVINIKIHYITEILKDFVLPISFFSAKKFCLKKGKRSCIECS
ncbi:MAG: Lrp/AsnC family transcriptional regulator [Promethearchaeia archaeon]